FPAGSSGEGPDHVRPKGRKIAARHSYFGPAQPAGRHLRPRLQYRRAFRKRHNEPVSGRDRHHHIPVAGDTCGYLFLPGSSGWRGELLNLERSRPIQWPHGDRRMSSSKTMEWPEANQRYLMAAVGVVRSFLERHSQGAKDDGKNPKRDQAAEKALRESADAMPAAPALETL